MQNPKTTMSAIVGWAGTLATVLGVLGSSCGGGQICSYVTLAGIILHQVAGNLGNASAQDGGV